MNRNPISPDPGFGEAAKYNAAAQTIDPDPVYAEGGSQPGDSGAKGTAAVKRYRTDAVKQVDAALTTSGGTPVHDKEMGDDAVGKEPIPKH